MAKTIKPAARSAAAKKPAAPVAAKKPTARAAAAPAADEGDRAKEFAAIQRKAKSVGAKAGVAHFDADGNPQGEWAAVLAQLDAWAKKYKVRFRTTEHVTGGDREGPTPRTHSACLTTITSTDRTDFVGGGHITIKTTCNLRRQTLITGRCVYSCVGEIVGMAT